MDDILNAVYRLHYSLKAYIIKYQAYWTSEPISSIRLKGQCITILNSVYSLILSFDHMILVSFLCCILKYELCYFCGPQKQNENSTFGKAQETRKGMASCSGVRMIEIILSLVNLRKLKKDSALCYCCGSQNHFNNSIFGVPLSGPTWDNTSVVFRGDKPLPQASMALEWPARCAHVTWSLGHPSFLWRTGHYGSAAILSLDEGDSSHRTVVFVSGHLESDLLLFN